MRTFDVDAIEKAVLAWKEGADPLAGTKLVECITDQYGEVVDMELQYTTNWIRKFNLINLVNFTLEEWGEHDIENNPIDEKTVLRWVAQSSWMSYDEKTDSFWGFPSSIKLKGGK
jgi:hypothetical protein